MVAHGNNRIALLSSHRPEQSSPLAFEGSEESSPACDVTRHSRSTDPLTRIRADSPPRRFPATFHFDRGNESWKENSTKVRPFPRILRGERNRRIRCSIRRENSFEFRRNWMGRVSRCHSFVILDFDSINSETRASGT